jgi:MFS transporter, SHS family, lactate transporter
VPESEAWKQHRAASTTQVLRIVAGQWRRFLYLVLLMTFMMFVSHGTQDLFPDFLKEVHGVAPTNVADIAVIYNIGAIVGAIFFGFLSHAAGRRQDMLAALALSLVVIPFWAFGESTALLVVAAFVMQMGVQGAWGVIPVHLNELSADAARGLMPGLAYQLGILFASPTNSVQYALRNYFGYHWALAGFETVTILSLAVLLLCGTEAHGREFVQRARVDALKSGARD